jgi:DNA-binding transcriptional MerR regulator
MTLLPVATCAQLLGIHSKTLHHWLKAANLPVTTHPSDARIKCLSEHHLQELARLHDRSLSPGADTPAPPEEPGASLPAPQRPPDQQTCPSPSIRMAPPDLMQRLSCLESRVVTLQEQLAELALALLAERERPLERRIAALETMTSGPLASPPPLPERQQIARASSPAAPLQVPRTLHPAEVNAHARLLPLIEYGACGTYVLMCPQEGELALLPDSPEWFAWLASLTSFRFVGQSGRFTASRKSKHHRSTRSWCAVRSLGNHNYKYHLGVTEHLTLARLELAAVTLQARRIAL